LGSLGVLLAFASIRKPRDLRMLYPFASSLVPTTTRDPGPLFAVPLVDVLRRHQITPTPGGPPGRRLIMTQSREGEACPTFVRRRPTYVGEEWAYFH
jgi:hypothetical protein